MASNKNLLVNSDFSIWQNFDQRICTDGMMAADCWMISRNTLCAYYPEGRSGVIIDAQDCKLPLEGEGFLSQYVEYLRHASGPFTLSFQFVDDGQVHVIHFQDKATNNQQYVNCATTNKVAALLWGGILAMRIQNLNGARLELKWVKLEEGEEATPYYPTSPAVELLKCRSSYQFSAFYTMLFDLGETLYGTVSLSTPGIQGYPSVTIQSVVIQNGQTTYGFQGTYNLFGGYNGEQCRIMIPKPSNFPFSSGGIYLATGGLKALLNTEVMGHTFDIW